MKVLIVLPILLPLVFAALTLALGARPALQRATGITGSIALVAAAVALTAWVARTGIQAVQLGGWPAPFGISFVADMFSAIMVSITAIVSCVGLVFAGGSLDTRRVRAGFYPLFALLVMGVSGAFLTGDLFNLYVWFEVLLMASFMLLVLGGEREQTAAAVKYVTLNLVSSAFFLSAVAILYRLTGTLNMADLAQRIPPVVHGPWLAAAILLLFVFGIKAAVFPLFFWLPASYHTPPPVISAIFSALLTKVGVYALVRTFTLLFPLNEGFLQPLLLVLASLTMVTGVLGAVAQNQLRRLLSFHIISQIGYMIAGLAIFTRAALAGSIFFVLHNILAKSNLFLISGVVLKHRGTEDLRSLGGFYETNPGLSALFLISALSLAGLPPLTGFVAKLALLQAGFASQQYATVVVMLAVSLLTLFSMIKIWNEAFWKPSAEAVPPLGPISRSLLYPIAFMAVLIVGAGLGGQALYALCERAAGELMDPQAYIQSVMG